MSKPRLPELLDEADDGIPDLSFRVVDRPPSADGQLAFTARAAFDGGTVGLQVVLGREWTHKAAGGVKVLRGSVMYRSVGEESDRLLRALAAACGVDADGARMKGEVTFSAVALEGDPAADPPRSFQLKLFFEEGGAKRYAEVYTNFDARRARLQIREKDPEYRRPLLAALTAAAPRKGCAAGPAPAPPAAGGGTAARPMAPIESKLANLRRRAAKDDVEVEHLVGFAVRGDPAAVPAIRELQRQHDWPKTYLVDGKHVAPLGRWADVVCLYLEGGLDALLAYARRREADSLDFAVSVLRELKTAPAAGALADLADEVGAVPKRTADAKKLVEAINVMMSFDIAPAIDRATGARLRSFLHRLLEEERLEVAWRPTALYALRGVGDEESVRLVTTMPTPPDRARDVAKVVKIIRKRLAAGRPG